MGPAGSKLWRATNPPKAEKATYQLDWWHLTRAFRRTFPDRPELVAQLKAALYGGQGGEVVSALGEVRVARALGVGDRERVATLYQYVRANQEGFYGAWQLREQLSALARLVAVVGSGAIEKPSALGGRELERAA